MTSPMQTAAARGLARFVTVSCTVAALSAACGARTGLDTPNGSNGPSGDGGDATDDASTGSDAPVDANGPGASGAVTSSSASDVAIEFFNFGGPSMLTSCIDDPCTIVSTPAITTVNRVGLGAYRAHFADGTFSGPPACECNTFGDGTNGQTYASGEPPLSTFWGFDTQGTSGLADSEGSCICVGPHGTSSTPKVTSSSTQDLRLESLVFGGPTPGSNCTANPCTFSGTPGFTAVYRDDPGMYRFPFSAGNFPGPSACVCNVVSQSAGGYTYSAATTPLPGEFSFSARGVGGLSDSQGSCICVAMHGVSATPTVTTSSAAGLSVETVTFEGAAAGDNCVSDPCTITATPAIAAVNRVGDGAYRAELAPNAFANPPACVCETVSQSAGGYTYASGEPPTTALYGFDTQGPSGLADSQGSCICVGK